VNHQSAKAHLAPFFLADGAKPFDNTLVAGLNQMAQLLYAERVAIAAAKKRVSAEGEPDKVDAKILAA